jgi:hypothetical protein
VIPGPLEVRLHGPVPVGRPLHLDHEDHTITVSEGETLLARGNSGRISGDPPEFVAFEEVADAVSARGPVEHHPFPNCFVCGPERAPNDGMRLFPAPVPGREVVAAPWIPHESLASPEGMIAERFVWAALDCPTYWPIAEPGEVALLGTLAADVLREVRTGDRCVVVARALGRENRKLFSRSAVYDESGELIGAAQATWIKVG